MSSIGAKSIRRRNFFRQATAGAIGFQPVLADLDGLFSGEPAIAATEREASQRSGDLGNGYYKNPVIMAGTS